MRRFALHYYLNNPFWPRIVIAVAVDAACLVSATVLAFSVLPPSFPPQTVLLCTVAGAFLCFGALVSSGAYLPTVAGRSDRSNVAIANTMALAFVAALFGFFVIPLSEEAVSALATTGAFYFPLLIFGRMCFRGIPKILGAQDRVLILEPNKLGLAIAHEIAERPGLGLQHIGFLGNESATDETDGVAMVGDISELQKIIVGYGVGTIVVAASDRDEGFPRDLLLDAKLRGVRVVSGDGLYEKITGRIYTRSQGSERLILSPGFREPRIAETVRRSMDVLGAAVALLLATPLLLISAIAIKVESKGPVFFRQVRVGRGGHEFKLVKLRSMSEGAEALSGPVFAKRHDDRITRVGRFLRLSRLDEVPQFWNVLIGDMSLVGPRPERPEFVEMLSDHLPLFRFRSAVKPGVTGWAQVRFGYVNELEAFEQKLALDLFYMKHRSIMLDLMVIGNTIKTVLLCRGL